MQYFGHEYLVFLNPKATAVYSRNAVFYDMANYIFKGGYLFGRAEIKVLQVCVCQLLLLLNIFKHECLSSDMSQCLVSGVSR